MNSKELQEWLASQTKSAEAANVLAGMTVATSLATMNAQDLLTALQLRENPAASISVSQEAQWVSNQYSGAFLRQVAEFRGLI